MQNDIPITTHRSKSKPEVQFQYGGLPFSETRSSFISVVHWDISSKFGMQIVFHLLKQVPSLNLNPKVDFWLHDRHLEKSIWRHNPDRDRRITTKFGRLKQNHMLRTKHRSKSKSEVKFGYGGRAFFENGNSFISALDWDISSKFGMQIDFHILKRMQPLTMNSEVAFKLYCRHLEKSIWCQKSTDVRPITTKCRRRMQNDMRIIIHTL